jgi:hypothetical protein
MTTGKNVHVVVVLASNVVNVKCDSCGKGKGLKQMGNHLGRHYWFSLSNLMAGIDIQSPIFSRVNGRLQTKYGLEEMSITARESAY